DGHLLVALTVGQRHGRRDHLVHADRGLGSARDGLAGQGVPPQQLEQPPCGGGVVLGHDPPRVGGRGDAGPGAGNKVRTVYVTRAQHRSRRPEVVLSTPHATYLPDRHLFALWTWAGREPGAAPELPGTPGRVRLVVPAGDRLEVREADC